MNTSESKEDGAGSKDADGSKETQRAARENTDDPHLDRDLRTLVRFIDIYCSNKHAAATREQAEVKGFDLVAMGKGPVALCTECSKLLAHALVKRSHCPMEPKPACKHCSDHCYHPAYRAKIQEVMRFSGRRLVLSGRLDLLFRLLF